MNRNSPRLKRRRHITVSFMIIGFLVMIVLETKVHSRFEMVNLSYGMLREKASYKQYQGIHSSQNSPSKVEPKPYTISESVRNEYKQWHSTVRRLSQMDRFPANWRPDVNWTNHPPSRYERFLTVDERIKYYMGKWYNTSIPMYGEQFTRDAYIQRQSTIQYQAFADILVNLYDLDKDRLMECYRNKKELQVFAPYCRDYVDVAILHSDGLANVIHFIGDALPSYVPDELSKYPMFAKVRPLCFDNGYINSFCRNDQIIHPIILPLNRKRHLGVAAEVPGSDIPWNDKKPLAVWRGKYEKIDHHTLGSINGSPDMKYALVSNHLNSSLVDAKFSKNNDGAPLEMIGSYLDMTDQLQYKYIISIEGNDVSSGLKWMLLSNSVVIAPRFTWESWAMEGLLVPYVHYLPINDDMSNVEEVVMWAENHPYETRVIAERSTLFIYDLLFHPDAVQDERMVLQGIMEKYENNFGVGNVRRLGRNPQMDRSTKAERFPSVDERVQYYMGQWGGDRPSISMKRDDIRRLTARFNTTDVTTDYPFIVSGSSLSRCSIQNSSYPEHIQKLCQNALPYFDERSTADLKSNSFKRLLKTKMATNMKFTEHSSWRKDSKSTKDSKRVLLGDSVKIINLGDYSFADNNIPIFSRWRAIDARYGPILWPFSLRSNIFNPDVIGSIDTDFESKGALSVQIKSPTEIGSVMSQVEVQEMLKYRYLVLSDDQVCRGNDLAWMLFSSSIVLMSIPQCTSWLMEPKLERFKHYIPIERDMSDVDDMVQWAEANIEQTLIISKHSTNFIDDLLFHPDAIKDEALVMEKIMEKYRRYYG